MGWNLPFVSFPTGFDVVDARAVTLGAEHGAVVLRDVNGTRRLFTWGRCAEGQCGNGATADVLTMGGALPWVNLGPGRVPVIASAGNYHTCVAASDARAYCFGLNLRGQLGLGHVRPIGPGPWDMGANLTAAIVESHASDAVTWVAAGGDRSCALIANGSLERDFQPRWKCWGDGRFGMLATRDAVNRGTSRAQLGAALPFLPIPPWSSLINSPSWGFAMGNTFSCFVQRGSVTCFGGSRFSRARAHLK